MSQAPHSEVVLEVRDLRTHFFPRRGTVKAVDGVSFRLRRGEVLGIVGESGSGKSVTALSVLQLLPGEAARVVGGEILLNGEDLLKKNPAEMRAIRGREIAMILQDPQTSLNPVFTVGNQLVEAIARNLRLAGTNFIEQAVDVLRRVRLAAPEQRVQQYPHEMSGGMKQRVVGAIAISCEPQVMIADEPTTALDVTIQLQYLNLLKELQASTDMGLLFITHDFGVVAHMCDRVAVMYAGRIVEDGPVREVFDNPAHPYTQALIASVPKMHEDVERLQTIDGQPPALSDLPDGCRFEPRCPYADARCQAAYPMVFEVGGDHRASCWRLDSAGQA